MRTHIVLDEQLMNEAMSLSQIKTKRELVEQALKEFISIRKRPNLLDLVGVTTTRVYAWVKRSLVGMVE